MRLNSITIENYRSIEKQTLEIKEVGGGFTYAFIGINESGKSSFLEAISLKEGLKIVTSQDFHDDTKQIIITFDYQLADDELNSLKVKLTESGLPEDIFVKLKIQNLLLKIVIDPGTSDSKKYVEFSPSTEILPAYTVNETSIIKKDETQTQDDLNIKNYLDQNLVDFVFTLSHQVIFWKSEPKFLITEPINLDTFIQDQNTSIPLRNCFILAGISDIPGEINKTRNSHDAINNLQEKLGDKVTEHIKTIWPDHPVSIKFQMDNSSISFLVEDEGVKYETKTTLQRSDGFRQFVSFLLTISAQSNTGQLSNSVLLLDEPETHLHPKGQENLRDELIKITGEGENNICIFATHSNYMIDKNNLGRCFMLLKVGNKRTELRPIDGIKSTYSEVNYIVFDIVTTDYHNELYGFLQERESLLSEKEFEDYLNRKGLKKNRDYTKVMKDGKTQKYKVTLPTYIRNLIHHPENTKNTYFTHPELNQSIRFLIDLKK